MSSPVTANKLFERALFYLERYAASADGVRTVLRRGLMRDARRGVEVPDEAAAWIEDVVQRLLAANYLNDASFATMKTRSLRRSGASSQKIKQKLMTKGVAPALIHEALAGEDGGDDKEAAITFAHKRRLGVFAPEAIRAAKRDKHLASLARAGFSHAIAKWIVDAEDEDSLTEP